MIQKQYIHLIQKPTLKMSNQSTITINFLYRLKKYGKWIPGTANVPHSFSRANLDSLENRAAFSAQTGEEIKELKPV